MRNKELVCAMLLGIAILTLPFALIQVADAQEKERVEGKGSYYEYTLNPNLSIGVLDNGYVCAREVIDGEDVGLCVNPYDLLDTMRRNGIGVFFLPPPGDAI